MRWEKRITLGRGVQIILALKLIIARWGRTREVGRERRSGRREGGREKKRERNLNCVRVPFFSIRICLGVWEQ